jgi:hypothetical protein
MSKKSDALLRKILKDWASRQRPPHNGRARLLWDAAQLARPRIDLSVLLFHPKFKPYPLSHTNEWPQTLFIWINENALQFTGQPRLI